MRRNIAIAFGVLVSLSLVSAMPVHAKEKAKEQHKAAAPEGASGYKYGMAGCGPGSMLFKENSKGSQIGASLLNGPSPISQFIPSLGFLSIVDSVRTFAITSGTSNCEDPSTVASHATVEFVDVNAEQLKKDVVRGDGETLTSFVELMGCSSAPELKRAMQGNYDMLFPGGKSDGNHVVDSLKDMVRKNSQLATFCPEIG